MFKRLDSRSDPLSQVLEAVRLDGVLSARMEMRAPWALHFGEETGSRAGFHVVVDGTCCVCPDNSESPLALSRGDVVVFPHGSGHRLADTPTTPLFEFGSLAAHLEPGGQLTFPEEGGGTPCTVLCGSYSFGADGGSPLLRGLPELLHLPADRIEGTPLAATVALLAAEGRGHGSGTAMAVDRLVDLLFIYALRAWLDLPGRETARTWFSALNDPLMGPAVRSIHDAPAEDWTVERLAQRAGVSRAVFARRFADVVGEPPLSYVTRWRMTVAAGLLGQGQRIAAVAQRVGYDNEFAFAKAFKRVRGVAPGQFRMRHALHRKSHDPVEGGHGAR